MSITEKLIVGLATIVSLVAAQAPASDAGKQPTGPPVLVRLNVAAFDTGGEAVRDLSSDDLKITDQGKPERILLFRRNDRAAGSPLGPHEYSNRPAGTESHSIAILFDLMNETKADGLDVWHKLRKSLPDLEPGDSVYFYLLTLEGNLTPIHAIGKPGDDSKWVQQVGDTFDKAMKAASHARPAGMGDEDMAKKTYVALETLANQLAAVSGRRDIIWITDGVPNVWNPKTTCNGDWVDCALYVPHLSYTLERAGVAVNPLSYSPTPNSSRDMDQMAGLTGGRTYSEQDIRAVINQVAKNAACSYTIYYDPSSDNWDSKFHKLKVTCERKSVNLLAKQRYFAYPDQRPAQARQQAALVAAYQSPLDSIDIGLRATIERAVGAPETVHLQIQIDPADVLLREENGHFTGGLTFLLVDLAPTGPIKDPAISNFTLNLTREQRDAAMKGNIPIAQDHALKDGQQKIRIMIQDQSTAAVGSLTIPVDSAHIP